MLFIGILVDLALAWAIVWLFANDTSNKLAAIGFVWLGLQAISILMALRGFACGLTAFKLGQSKVAEDSFLAGAEDSRFPRPRAYESSVSDYLEQIMENDSLDIGVRIRAALMLGSKLTIGECLGPVRTMLIDSAQSRALKRYHQLRRD
jgi:hypothetical protein